MDIFRIISAVLTLLGVLISLTIYITQSRHKTLENEKDIEKVSNKLEHAIKEVTDAMTRMALIQKETSIVTQQAAKAIEALVTRLEVNNFKVIEVEAQVKILKATRGQVGQVGQGD